MSDLSRKNESVSVYFCLFTWNCLLSGYDMAAEAAARSMVLSGCKAGCEWPELCYNDGGIYTV